MTTNFEEKNTFDLSVPCEWPHYQLWENVGIVGIGPSKPMLWLIELEQITTKPFAWMLIYDTITTNFEGKNTFDLSVPCEWPHYQLWGNVGIVGIGPSKPMLWLIELEQITTKPFAWMLIYDKMTTNFEGKNTFDLSVPCEWPHYQLWGNVGIVGIGPSKPMLWLIELEQITTKPFAWMLIHDTITTNFEGKNTFDLSVPCEWPHYQLWENVWIVGIGPSKPKLWLIELEQITTKPFAWMLIYDTFTTNFEGKNTFDLSVPCEWPHYQLWGNVGIVGIGPSKPMLWLIELEQITTKPFAWMLIYDTITTNFEGKNTFDLSVPCEWPHYQLWGNVGIVGIGSSKPMLWLIELEQITTKPFAWMLIYDTITTNFEGKNTFDLSVPCEWPHYQLRENVGIVGIGPSKQKLWLIELEQITTKPFAWMLIYDTFTTNFEGKNTFDLSVPCEWPHYQLWGNVGIVGIGPSKPMLWLIELEQITTKPFAWMLIYDTITTNFEGKNTFDLSVPCEWPHYQLRENVGIVGIGPSKQKLWLIELEQITTKPFAWIYRVDCLLPCKQARIIYIFQAAIHNIIILQLIIVLYIIACVLSWTKYYIIQWNLRIKDTLGTI